MSEALNLTLHAIEPFRPFGVGLYRVMALRAAHDSAPAPLLYLIERDGRCLFYATDTGPLPEETWAALRRWARLVPPLQPGDPRLQHGESRSLPAARRARARLEVAGLAFAASGLGWIAIGLAMRPGVMRQESSRGEVVAS